MAIKVETILGTVNLSKRDVVALQDASQKHGTHAYNLGSSYKKLSEAGLISSEGYPFVSITFAGVAALKQARSQWT